MRKRGLGLGVVEGVPPSPPPLSSHAHAPRRVLHRRARHPGHQLPLLGGLARRRLVKAEAVPVDKRTQRGRGGGGGRAAAAAAAAVHLAQADDRNGGDADQAVKRDVDQELGRVVVVRDEGRDASH